MAELVHGIDFVQGDVFTVELQPRAYDLVYADPPYANCRARYARNNGSRQWGRDARADFMRDLIARMESLRFPQGVCAVSMSTPELRLLPLFPSCARVFAWVKPDIAFRPKVYPAFAWEPVVAWGEFPIEREITARDWLCSSSRVARAERFGHEAPKPPEFATWVFDVTMGSRRGRVCELFAGSGPMLKEANRRGMEAVGVDFDAYPIQFDLTACPSDTSPDREAKP